MEGSESPFLESYDSSSWPADTAVGIAALGIYDQVVEPRYRDVIERWVRAAKERLDPRYSALGHHADPEDIASMVTFLASDKAKFITGQAINVDGGMVKATI